MARARERARTGDAAPVWEQRFERALENAERFFLKEGNVHQAAVALADRLNKANVPYAV